MTEEVGTANACAESATMDKAVIAARDTLGEFLDTASVERVYGEPIKKDDTTIIPTAEVLVGLGFGLGSGYGGGPQSCCQEATQGAGEASSKGAQGGWGGGGGGGGGGRTLSRPVAIIVISPSGIRVEPVVDVTKVALAAFTAAGFMLAMIGRMMRPGRGYKPM
ncbi:MAG: hypothetical protein ACUVWR_12315 [Anaerolineae bacterium]